MGGPIYQIRQSLQSGSEKSDWFGSGGHLDTEPNQLQFTLILSSLNAFQRWAASALLLLSTIFAQF
jgi:hypothetical protein